MTNEEAILNIDMALSEVEWQYPMDYAVAFKMAVQALEKQIPKKPIEEQNLMTCAVCGCREIQYVDWCGIRQMNYCPCCGQAIDWSGNND